MDELHLFRNFRRGVVAPSEDAVQRAAALLASAVDREQAPPARGAWRLIEKRPRYGAFALVALAAATIVALVSSTPWSNSPGLLARAEAALTPPAGTILHMKWELTTTSTDLSCTVTHGPNEIWIDQTRLYTYRAILGDFPADPDPGRADPRAIACSSGTEAEIGGQLVWGYTIRFVPPDTLSASSVGFFFPLDPVADLRWALGAGRAHDEGKVELDGRMVERIRLDPPSACPRPPCPRDPSYAYVDPETLYPVQTESPNGLIAVPGHPVVRLDMVMRYPTYEYLPRTAANLKLTRIRAQHPNATGP